MRLAQPQIGSILHFWSSISLFLSAISFSCGSSPLKTITFHPLTKTNVPNRSTENVELWKYLQKSFSFLFLYFSIFHCFFDLFFKCFFLVVISPFLINIFFYIFSVSIPLNILVYFFNTILHLFLQFYIFFRDFLFFLPSFLLSFLLLVFKVGKFRTPKFMLNQQLKLTFLLFAYFKLLIFCYWKG